MATGFTLRNRLLLFQAEYRDAIGGVAFFCALAVAAAVPIVLSQNNRVVSTLRVGGIVENVTPMPISPKAIASRGLYFPYGIRLNDSNALIFVDGELDTPHMIGSEVSVERQHHKNDTDTYRLAERP